VIYRTQNGDLPLQKAIAVTIDGTQSLRVGNADMVRLYPHHGSVLLVSFMDGKVAVTTSGLQEEPKVGELSRKRSRETAKAL
jgi:hypothetical protein